MFIEIVLVTQNDEFFWRSFSELGAKCTLSAHGEKNICDQNMAKKRGKV
jgi:hypothetical protein